MSTRRTTLIFLLVLATFAVFILGAKLFLLSPKPSLERPSPTTTQEISPQEAADTTLQAATRTTEEFSRSNKTLSRHTITGVKDLDGPYKKVTVGNSAVTFSFEVPDRWLTETRNSGEVEMNAEEMREFLGTNYDGDIRAEKVCTDERVPDSRGNVTIEKICGKPSSDYADLDWDTLKNMSPEDMRKRFGMRGDFSLGFPNATVTPDSEIVYADIGWDQVHFYILDEEINASYLSDVSFSKTIAETREKYRISEDKFLKEVERDKEGRPMADKGNLGGFVDFIKHKNYVVRIWKEAYVEGEFETGFTHILETLSFE